MSLMDLESPPLVHGPPEELALSSRTSPWSVSRLVAVLDGLVREGCPSVWVEGEIVDLSTPASGHRYFALRDARAMIRCVLFARNVPASASFLATGRTVLVQGRTAIYQPRGTLQIIVDRIEEGGEGARHRELEELKKALAAEGLFRTLAERRPLPALPSRIAVITSPSGAAIQDVLRVLARRLPLVPVRLYATAVQGVHAPLEITAAFERFAKRRDADLVLLIRGGGSYEDLAAFNTRAVVSAVRHCPVPVVTGIGHETDKTLADFAADFDGTTPSGAAERAVPDRSELQARLSTLHERLQLRHPRRRIEDRIQRLDERHETLIHALRRRLATYQSQLARGAQALSHPPASLSAAERRLRLLAPTLSVSRLSVHHERLSVRVERARERLHYDLHALLATLTLRLSSIAGRLHSHDPTAVLDRGFALVRDAEGRLVHDGRSLRVGTPLMITWRHESVDVVTTSSARPLSGEEVP